jgi:putative aldouronate transport system substrate-binding protein
MLKLKKTLCFTVAMLMVVSLASITGCNQKSEEPEQTQGKETKSETTKAQENEEKELKPVTLKWYFGYNAVDADRDKIFEKMNEVTKEKINATVEFNVVDFSTWSEKINILLSSGELMDISWHNWQMSYAANVAKKMYMPLDDLLNEYGQGILEDIPADLLDIQRIGGKIHAIPNYQISTVQNAYAFKKDIVNAVGFDVSTVKNYKNLEPLLEKVKANYPDAFPIQGREGSLWTMVMRELEFESIVKGRTAPLSVKYGDSSKTVFNTYASKEYKEYCELMHEWNKKGYFREDVASVKNVTAEEKAGKYAVMIGGTSYYPGSVSAGKSAQVGYEVTEAITSNALWESTAGQATMNVIPSSSQNPERAMMLLNLLNNDEELATLFAYGIEGKHYEKLADSRVKRIKDSGYDFNWQWAVLNTFKIPVTDNNPPDHNERILKTHANALASPIAGLVVDTEPFMTELSQVNTAWEEMGIGLQTGLLDPEEYLPKFLDKLEEAGINKILTEVQKQVDEQLK